MTASCLTCRNARKLKSTGQGEAWCMASGSPVAVSHVCLGWVGLDAFSSFHNAKREQGFSSCSASTTATNSTSVEKTEGFR